MELYVARQPIFDTHTNVVAYELLYRSGPVNAFDGTEGNTATGKVISASFYSPGGREIMGGKPVFINFPRELLVNGGGAILPPNDVVIEILETVESDPEVLAACRDLRAKGYRLALDDCIPEQKPQALIDLMNYIKVDFRATGKEGLEQAVHRCSRIACMVAEKVETQEEFNDARAMGYQLFQGYFFARPVIISTRDVPPLKLNRLRILQQLHRPEMDFAAITELIKHESSLSYKLLRFVNSALFSLRKPLESIQQAVAYIGEAGLRRWLSIVVLTDINGDRPNQLAVNALVRARLCESLAPEAGLGGRSGDLFLLGLFSHLDAMYGRPLEELLDGLSLRDDICEILIGRRAPGDRAGALWQTVIAYERGHWDDSVVLARAAGISPGRVPALYAAAVKWADQVMHGTLAPAEEEAAPAEDAEPAVPA